MEILAAFSGPVPAKYARSSPARDGFEDIKVYDWDTGIGAYSTTIADRPALKHWLYELLPSGKSRILLVSQEDRLFRDRWETEPLNRQLGVWRPASAK